MPDSAKFDMNYRPQSYWDDEKAVLANIKGQERRKIVQAAVEQKCVEALPNSVFADGLDDLERDMVSRIHPALMGGEYLPDYLPGEVEIARICFASVTGDVISVRARLVPDGIAYRVMDEYWDEPQSQPYKVAMARSKKPLTLKELIYFIDHTQYPENPVGSEGSGLVVSMWESDQYMKGDEWPESEGFVQVESEFYRAISRWYYEKEQETIERYRLDRGIELDADTPVPHTDHGKTGVQS
jgi:hypothetical protein